MSQVHSSRRGFHNLFYDHFDRLFSVEVQKTEQTLFVTTDLNGTPEFVFNDQGALVNRFMRSPYGALISEVTVLFGSTKKICFPRLSHFYIYFHFRFPQEDENFWIPLGYHGCIGEPLSGVVIFPEDGGRPYDSHLGQWMTPNWMALLSGFKDVRKVFSYRSHSL